MSEGHELTIKQILDSEWVRGLGRLAMIITPILLTGGGGIVSWIMLQNWQTSVAAVAAAEAAQATAAATVQQVKDIAANQDSYTRLADQIRKDDQAWRSNLDERIVRLDQRLDLLKTEVTSEIGGLKGDIGELKGLIVRKSADVMFGPPASSPAVAHVQ